MLQPNAANSGQSNPLSNLQVEKFRETAQNMLSMDTEAAKNGKTALFMASLIILDSDSDGWPYLMPKDRLVTYLRESYQLWECLES